MEDDMRYPSKPYSLNPYNPPRRPRNPICNAPFSHPVSSHYKIEEEDDNDDEKNDVELEEDLDNKNPDGYYRNLEGDGEFVDRHSKERKLRNSIPEFKFDFASVPRSSRTSKPLYSGANWNEHAVFVLSEVWGDRFLQLGRKILRFEDWNDVAEKVLEASKMEKDELQCRTMLDKL
ncbi:uncharacterized protein LOC112035261 [Quercus suber]|uniref:Trihelix transcription factor asil1 n=1 Tax=Quercus suber TaxID=58331 RepID=A0AAW0LN18_QUESU|nr:uncharacterized protein LOC112035261 [Quercus suber]POF27420.1 trihelix transcription factor asil1 [Quercus suber]